MRLEDALRGVSRLGLDTSPIIYLIERDRRRLPILADIFRRIDVGEVVGITSVVTLSEVLVQPFLQGNVVLCGRYRDLLLNSSNFLTLSIDPSIAELSSRLRANHRLRTPDALQISAALDAGCEAFLTNDPVFTRGPEIRTIVLDEMTL